MRSFRRQPAQYVGTLGRWLKAQAQQAARIEGGGGVQPQRPRIDLTQPCLQTRKRPIIHQIALGQDHGVGDGKLLGGFSVRIQRRDAVDGIQRGHHPIDSIVLLELRIGHQGVQDRGRIRQPGRFDHNPLELTPALLRKAPARIA